MNIGWAMQQIRNGDKVARAEWKGRGIWIILKDSSEGEPYIYLQRTQASSVRWSLPWQPVQEDIIADDWELA
jgi:uncharacterized protein DUF2829